MTKKIWVRCLLILLAISTASAQSSTAVTAYMMLKASEQKEPYKTFLWTGENNGPVSLATRNWNRPLFELWGVSDRYPGTRGMPIPNVRPYNETDPGFVGPDGEEFGVEIEFNDRTILPRQTDSENVRFYTDFGQTNANEIGMTRAEIQIRTTLQKLDVEEGSTLWLGWSEKYTYLDKEKITTVFQFRNQPSDTVLAEKGFDAETISEISQNGYTSGGPAAGIITTPINGELHYKFSARVGTPFNWSVPNENTHTIAEPIKLNTWYDFIVEMKYSQQNDGAWRIWVFEHNDDAPQTYKVTQPPVWQFQGPTMYTYPSNYAFAIPSPEIRTGVYRHDRVNQTTPISDQHRYMTKYLGPLRLWRGDSDIGFEKVTPRSE